MKRQLFVLDSKVLFFVDNIRREINFRMYRLVFRCIEINMHVSVRLKEQIGYSQN